VTFRIGSGLPTIHPASGKYFFPSSLLNRGTRRPKDRLESHGKETLMSSLVLKILLTLYILYALLKFFEFFFRSDEAKIRGLRSVYSGDNRVIKVFDNVILVLMLIFVGLLFVAGVEYLSFTTGLLVGMSIIQVYFHRFSDPLPPEKSPDPPITALKMMSYSIQANPGKAWKELVFMTVLFVWALYMLAARGFGFFR
jgi:hypothetical protein